MALDKNSLAELYAKRASGYDFTANAYYLLGFREFAYRKEAIRSLNLKRGDTVVEIGCGTGLNFSGLVDGIGPEGKLIGVDLTPEMLEQAANATVLIKSCYYAWKFVQEVKIHAKAC